MTPKQDSFANKIVLITGGSSGIGLALAKDLAGQGAQVWILARRQDMLLAAQREIGSTCKTLSMDVSNWEGVTNAVKKIEHQNGVPDLVINSAGITYPGYVQYLGIDIFRSMMETNYFGTVNIIKAVLPGMLKRGSGHIVNISSVAGFLGVFGYSAYGASKYAVSGFSDILRAELKPHGIQVSVVYPPDTDTPQLAFETPLKPIETKALAGTAKVVSAESVARATLSGIKQGRYIILPGFDAKLLYHANNLIRSGLSLVMDWMINNARRKARNST